MRGRTRTRRPADGAAPKRCGNVSATGGSTEASADDEHHTHVTLITDMDVFA